MTEQSIRDELADEISGVVTGEGYYSTSIGIDAAHEAADLILASPVIRRIQAEARAEGFREGVNFIDNDPSLSWGGSMVAGRNEAARRMASIENVTDD